MDNAFTFTHKSQVHVATYVILAFYWASPRKFYTNNHAELLAMLDHWLINRFSPSEIATTLGIYPVTAFPDVCVCGHVINSYNSILRTSCHKCQNRHTKHGYFSTYVLNKISGHINTALGRVIVTNESLERILCEVIYNESISSTKGLPKT